GEHALERAWVVGREVADQDIRIPHRGAQRGEILDRQLIRQVRDDLAPRGRLIGGRLGGGALGGLGAQRGDPRRHHDAEHDPRTTIQLREASHPFTYRRMSLIASRNVVSVAFLTLVSGLSDWSVSNARAAPGTLYHRAGMPRSQSDTKTPRF